MVKRSFEQALDACLARLASGEDPEQLLREYADMADALRPLLTFAVRAQREIPVPTRREENKAELLAAVAERKAAVATADRCVDAVRRGVALEELRLQLPSASWVLARAAWLMQVTAPPVPLHRASGKRRLMAMAARRHLARKAARPALDRVREAMGEVVAGLFGAPTAPRRAWSMAVASMAVFVVLAAGVAGIGTVAASSLPGEPFYGIKRLSESAQLMFAFDPVRRADLGERFRRRRLDEIVDMADVGRDVPLDLVVGWVAGEGDAFEGIRCLPDDDQRTIATTILNALDDGEGLADWVRRLDADPDAVEQVVRWARGVLSPTPVVSDDVTPVGARAPVAPSKPLPGPRPLPPEDLKVSRCAVEETPAPETPVTNIQPAPIVEVASTSGEPEKPAYVQPGNETPDHEKAPEAVAATAPEAPADVTAEPEEPPPYVQPPPGEQATPTPGDAEGAGGEELPSP